MATVHIWDVTACFADEALGGWGSDFFLGVPKSNLAHRGLWGTEETIAFHRAMFLGPLQVTQDGRDMVQSQQQRHKGSGRGASQSEARNPYLLEGLNALRPTTTTGGRGHPFYNLVQLAKLLNV